MLLARRLGRRQPLACRAPGRSAVCDLDAQLAPFYAQCGVKRDAEPRAKRLVRLVNGIGHALALDRHAPDSQIPRVKVEERRAVVQDTHAESGGARQEVGAERHVQSEVHVLSAHRHQNLVVLTAFSMEPGRPMCLVYPFMSGGALREALRDGAIDVVAQPVDVDHTPDRGRT